MRLERSVEDLAEQLNASKLALKYAERGDFTYLSKLVPGGQVRRSQTFALRERGRKLPRSARLLSRSGAESSDALHVCSPGSGPKAPTLCTFASLHFKILGLLLGVCDAVRARVLKAMNACSWATWKSITSPRTPSC